MSDLRGIMDENGNITICHADGTPATQEEIDASAKAAEEEHDEFESLDQQGQEDMIKNALLSMLNEETDMTEDELDNILDGLFKS